MYKLMLVCVSLVIHNPNNNILTELRIPIRYAFKLNLKETNNRCIQINDYKKHENITELIFDRILFFCFLY